MTLLPQRCSVRSNATLPSPQNTLRLHPIAKQLSPAPSAATNRNRGSFVKGVALFVLINCIAGFVAFTMLPLLPSNYNYQPWYSATAASATTSERTTGRNSNVVVGLDFYIVGFPKCGTTTLLYAFRKQRETAMLDKEYCELEKTKYTTEEAFSGVNDALSQLTTSLPVSATKFGVKCPTSISSRSHVGIRRLTQRNKGSKLIVGMRHPVFFFQSFYNYRITEMHNKGNVTKIPPPMALVGRTWKGVSTDLARYEKSLERLLAKGAQSSSYPYQQKESVFIYSLEQLGDDNAGRAKAFRDKLQNFLGLKESIEAFPFENVNGLGRRKKFSGQISICDEEHKKLRSLLVANGEMTQRWIKNELLTSQVVVLGDRDRFLDLIKTWGVDPCRGGV